MSAKRKTYRAAVYVILKKNGKYLLIRRYNTGYRDGQYTFPAGHVDDGETAVDAAVRELGEEVATRTRKSNLRLVHVMQHREGEHDYFDFYFMVSKWSGKPRICEPDKIDDLRWLSFDDLKVVAIPSITQAILEIDNGELFSSIVL